MASDLPVATLIGGAAMAKHDTVELRVGDEHSVELEGLMSAGYVWEPELAGHESVVEVTKEEGEGNGPDLAVGSGPAEIFTIKALKPGTTTVRFAQRRPWESGSEADEHIVDLHVAE
jgi:predicted secreted protein